MNGVIPILQFGASLIVPLQGDLHDNALISLQGEILRRIEQTGCSGLILDISSLGFVDSYAARVLGDIAASAGLMGTRSVLVGMSPAIAVVLIDLGLRMKGIPTARNLETGLALLRELVDEGGTGPGYDSAYDPVANAAAAQVGKKPRHG